MHPSKQSRLVKKAIMTFLAEKPINEENMVEFATFLERSVEGFSFSRDFCRWDHFMYRLMCEHRIMKDPHDPHKTIADPNGKGALYAEDVIIEWFKQNHETCARQIHSKQLASFLAFMADRGFDQLTTEEAINTLIEEKTLRMKINDHPAFSIFLVREQ